MKKKKPKTSTPTLPVELLANILSRLPPKTVAQLSCVSKEWASIPSNPYFVKLYCQQQHQNLKLIARHGLLYSLDLDSLDCALRVDYPLQGSDFYVQRVLGLSNGMLCLSVWNPNPTFLMDIKPFPVTEPNNEIIVICNISTGARHIVPSSPVEFDPRSIPTIPWAKLRRRFCYGFAFDPFSDDYILVRISQYLYCEPKHNEIVGVQSEVKVYSMRTDSWSKIDESMISGFYISLTEPVFADGDLYWFASEFGDNYLHDGHQYIVAFDLPDLKFRRVHTIGHKPRVWGVCLGLRGRLSVNWARIGKKYWCKNEPYGELGSWIIHQRHCCTIEDYEEVVPWIPLASFQAYRRQKRHHDDLWDSDEDFDLCYGQDGENFWFRESFIFDKVVSWSKNGDRVLIEQYDNNFIGCDFVKETAGVCQVKFFPVQGRRKRKRRQRKKSRRIKKWRFIRD